MSVNISIKNVPDELAAQVKKRAARNHRSLQGELVAILESAVKDDKQISPLEYLAMIKDLKLNTASESTSIVRDDREAR
ncbi:MAG: Arc family DNA-binding protein [Thermodesulfobacteriota bacterium]